MEQETPFYTRKHCEIKRITNVPDGPQQGVAGHS
jgi:hypothetical protein